MLGIDVWVSRSGRVAPDAVMSRADNAAPLDATADTPVKPEASAPVPSRRDVSALTHEMRQSLKASSAPRSSAPRSSAAASPATPVESRPETVGSGSQNAAPQTDDLPVCRIICLALPGGVLLADARDLKSARRLGRDLLAALDGNWQHPPTETLFDWPPQQALGVSVSGKRALTAFIARQLDELPEGGVIIACARVGTLLPELAGAAAQRTQRVVETEMLTELASDTDAKRRLWTQIQQLTA